MIILFSDVIDSPAFCHQSQINGFAMRLFDGNSVNTKLLIIFSFLLIALFLSLGYNNYRRERSLIIKGAVDNARAVSHQIIETRNYLAKHVILEPDLNPNLIPQVAATSIAKQLTAGSQLYVRQVSLRYRNPGNKPDQFEAAQLSSFHRVKAVETWQVTTRDGEKTLRYMLPMVADKSCLACHESYDKSPPFVKARFPDGHFSYGYKVGDVIGAVSVSVPLQDLYKQVGVNLKLNILIDSVSLVLFILVTGWVIRKVILEHIKKVSSLISTVAKTGNFSERLVYASNDEIGELVVAFNELMSELDHKSMQKTESEERYRNFIEIAQSPIITFMEDGKIVIANRRAENLFGLSKQELLGQCFFDFLENPESFEKAVKNYYSAGSSELIGVTTLQKIRNIYGQLFEVELVISVSHSDQTPLFSAILRNIK